MDLGGMADKAKDYANDNPDKVDQAADTVNEKTDNKYEDQVNSAADHFGGGNDEENKDN